MALEELGVVGIFEMKTAVIEVGDLVSVLSAAGVEKKPQQAPGAHHADVSPAAA